MQQYCAVSCQTEPVRRMTKHHLQIMLGQVRAANLQGRLYPVPPPGAERRALNFLVRNGAVLAQLGTPTSAAGYVALAKPDSARSEPVRKAQPPLKVGQA